ncbi:MAG: hypothetical protein ABIJ74_01865 [archaeon]
MRKWLLFVFIILFVLVLSNFVFACVAAPRIILGCTVEENILDKDLYCLNQTCDLNLTKKDSRSDHFYLNGPDSISYPGISVYEGEGVGISYKWFSEGEGFDYTEEFFLGLELICKENLDDLKPILGEKIEKWRNREIFVSGGLTFELYSKEREQKLIESRNSLERCYYDDFERVGNWFVVTRASRDYCYLSNEGGIGIGPYHRISDTEFIKFLLSNPSIETIPYLLAYILFIVIFVGCLIYLYKRKELENFFKPTKLHLILVLATALYSFLLFIAGVDLIDMIMPLVLVYVIASIIDYVFFRMKKNK